MKGKYTYFPHCPFFFHICVSKSICHFWTGRHTMTVNMLFKCSYSNIFNIISREKSFTKLNKIGELLIPLFIFPIRVIEKSQLRGTSGDCLVQPSVGSWVLSKVTQCSANSSLDICTERDSTNSLSSPDQYLIFSQ